MEEFMRLYEKQKRLDEETKLKLANMQVQSAGVFQLRFPNVPHCIVFLNTGTQWKFTTRN